MSADISSIAFAVTLAMASVLAAILARRGRTAAKIQIDVAAALFAMLAVAQVAASQLDHRFVEGVAVFALATAPAAIVLAVYAKLLRTPASSIAVAAISASAIAGIAAIVFTWPALAFLPLLASVIALLVLAVVHLRKKLREALLTAGTALALVAAASAFVSGARLLTLFGAVAMLGIGLVVAPASRTQVEQQGWRRRTLVIRRKR
jgi:hypothetical protein